MSFESETDFVKLLIYKTGIQMGSTDGKAEGGKSYATVPLTVLLSALMILA
jgi:hypothetical protein